MTASSLLSHLGGILEGGARIIVESRPQYTLKKSHLDYVTNIDILLDDFLLKNISVLTPGIPVLSEERRANFSGDSFWIVDPLDGTHNFIEGLPHVGLCAALYDMGSVVASGVYDVFGRHLYLAAKGEGATADGSPLKIKEETSNLLAVSTGALCSLVKYPDVFTRICEVVKIRNIGCQSLQLAGVARGYFGGAISEEAKIWDDVAASLICSEAGACYKSLSGDLGGLEAFLNQMNMKSVCAHPALFDFLLSMMEKVWKEVSV